MPDKRARIGEGVTRTYLPWQEPPRNRRLHKKSKGRKQLYTSLQPTQTFSFFGYTGGVAAYKKESPEKDIRGDAI
jgi:hypothetical protein